MPSDATVWTDNGLWRLEHAPTPTTPAANTIRLIHVPTGRVLLDLTGTSVDAEQSSFSADERLLRLRLSRVDRRIVGLPVTVDLATGLCYHHPDPRQAHAPIGDLADVVESLVTATPPAERDWSAFVPRWVPKELLDLPGADVGDVLSPDGRFLIDLTSNASRMSRVVHPAKIVEVATGDVLLDLWGTVFDTRAAFEHGTGRLLLTLTRYPEAEATIHLAIDLDREIYWDPAGPLTDRPRGYLDELQQRFGRDESGFDVRADWVPTVRRSKRPDDTPPANPVRWASYDGVWALYLEQFEIRPGLKPRQARIEHAPSGQNALDLRGSSWACNGEFIEGCSQLRLTIADLDGTNWVRVKIDMDCKLYWEEDGTPSPIEVVRASSPHEPDLPSQVPADPLRLERIRSVPGLGAPGGIQAGALADLQARFGATLADRSRLGLVIETPLACNPDQPRAVLSESAIAESQHTPVHAEQAQHAEVGPVAQLAASAEELGLPRDAMMALRIAREVSEGRLTPEQGAAELARWLT